MVMLILPFLNQELNVIGCRGMCDEPNLRLANVPTLKKVHFSKPGPYVSLEKLQSVRGVHSLHDLSSSQIPPPLPPRLPYF